MSAPNSDYVYDLTQSRVSDPNLPGASAITESWWEVQNFFTGYQLDLLTRILDTQNKLRSLITFTD